jgi:hypothetical protein
MKKRERLIVAIPPSLEELQNELARFPQKDRAARLRELAWLGLMMKGGSVMQVQTPPISAAVPEMVDEGEARRAKAAAFKAKIGFG